MNWLYPDKFKLVVDGIEVDVKNVEVKTEVVTFKIDGREVFLSDISMEDSGKFIFNFSESLALCTVRERDIFNKLTGVA